MFDAWLAECRANFGPVPRRIGWWDRWTYWRVPRPDWLYQQPDDQLETYFLNLARLRTTGFVTWGLSVQMNRLLFEPGPDDCPGEVVYSLEDSESIAVQELERISRDLFALKSQHPADPELARYAELLRDERIRQYGVPVPRSISPRFRCRTSVIYVVRKHLPVPCLRQSVLPLVVTPEPPFVVTVLPSRYWPERLRRAWTGG